MHPVDIKACLDSMVVLYDTREHRTEQAAKRYLQIGCPVLPQHIDYGDYTYSFTMPDGKCIYELGKDKVVKPPVSIERKASLEELSHNIIQDKETFEKEFTRAKNNGARVYLLLEEGNMEKIYNGKYKTKVHPNAYKSSLWAIIARYKLSGPIFCKKETAGKVIHDILYRELKERLESGFYG